MQNPRQNFEEEIKCCKNEVASSKKDHVTLSQPVIQVRRKILSALSSKLSPQKIFQDNNNNQME